MNRNKRFFAVALLLLGTASFLGGCCKEPEQPTPQESKKELIFLWDELLLGKGAEHDLAVIPEGFDEDPDYIHENMKWESNDTTIVTVNENGNVHALSAGNTTITASYNQVTCTCSISVAEGYDITVPEEITLKVGETKTVDSEKFTSKGGCYDFVFEMYDNSYYASLPSIQIISGLYQYAGTGGGQHFPEYKYSGLRLIGKHEGTTHLRIYNTESGFDTSVPVTVIQETNE